MSVKLNLNETDILTFDISNDDIVIINKGKISEFPNGVNVPTLCNTGQCYKCSEVRCSDKQCNQVHCHQVHCHQIKCNNVKCTETRCNKDACSNHSADSDCGNDR